MKLRTTAHAYAKLNALWAHLFEVNRFAAKRLREQAARSLGRLRTFPLLGSPVAEFPASPIRQVIVEPYRFFYYIEERTKTIWLVDVWHGAQIPAYPSLPQPSAPR